MEAARERAVNELRYGGGMLGLPQVTAGRQYQPTPEELAEQKLFMRNIARREALGHTLALGRRYDDAHQAIEDAKVIAAWIGLEIE